MLQISVAIIIAAVLCTQQLFVFYTEPAMVARQSSDYVH